MNQFYQLTHKQLSFPFSIPAMQALLTHEIYHMHSEGERWPEIHWGKSSKRFTPKLQNSLWYDYHMINTINFFTNSTSHCSFQTKDWAAFHKLNVILCLSKSCWPNISWQNPGLNMPQEEEWPMEGFTSLSANWKVRCLVRDLCWYSLSQPVNKPRTISSISQLLQDRINCLFKVYFFPHAIKELLQTNHLHLQQLQRQPLLPFWILSKLLNNYWHFYILRTGVLSRRTKLTYYVNEDNSTLYSYV